MSELRSVLVHLDDDAAGCVRRLQAAQRLAAAHAARLDTLYTVTPSLLQNPYAFTIEAGAASLLIAAETEQRARARTVFERERAGTAGLAGVNWQEARGEPVSAFVRRGWAADLLVLGQHDPDPAGQTGAPADFATSVLIDSGKPALVLPYVDTGARLGDRVIVAWKPTRESARAVTAALPLLRRARQVDVIAWDEEAQATETRTPLEIEAFLQHHDITATLHRGVRPSGGLGELLLSQAADLQADLLVMGCYGHGRAREWVLGGVTRTVLRSMTLPVLMVH
ncbi:universal stress protein [Methylibium petroleiphilum]|uniref:universal stress protein n=1 Tax=Methylibium petroleiphilum TaxID=105560 RepID=UPI003D266637